MKPKWNAAKDAFFKSYSNALESISEWNASNLELVFKDLANTQRIKPGELQLPLRIMLVGEKMGPPVFEIASLLGKEETTETNQQPIGPNRKLVDMKKLNRFLYILALIKFIASFFPAKSVYEPHRDELLYLAEGSHPAFGFYGSASHAFCFCLDYATLGKYNVLDQMLALTDGRIKSNSYWKNCHFGRRQTVFSLSVILLFFLHRLSQSSFSFSAELF